MLPPAVPLSESMLILPSLAEVYVDGLVARCTANGGASTSSDAASGRGDFTFEIDGAVCRHGIADDQAGYCGSQNAFHGNGHD